VIAHLLYDRKSMITLPWPPTLHVPCEQRVGLHVSTWTCNHVLFNHSNTWTQTYAHALSLLSRSGSMDHSQWGLSLLKAKLSEDISYNGTERSGTSGRQLKLIDYRLLVPNRIHCVCLSD